MRIVALSGSLQASSSNTALLHTLARQASPDVAVEVWPSLVDVPYYNPDIDVGRGPVPVQRLRAAIGAADAVVIASPEYAHSMPGVLKNALDWIVPSGELYGKPIVLLSASPRPDGGALGRDALLRTLNAQGALIVFSSSVQLSSGPSRAEDLASARTIAVLGTALDAVRRSPAR